MVRHGWMFLSILLTAVGCDASESSLFDDPGPADGSLADGAAVDGGWSAESDASTNADAPVVQMSDGSRAEAAADAMLTDVVGRMDAPTDAKSLSPTAPR